MTELLPCPICGHDAELVEGWYVYCPNRSCWVDGTALEDTEAEAVEAWNTRVERTCKNATLVAGWFVCSSCGYQENYFGDENYYCPNCGAKVIA